jgi:hypothetical protein
LKACHEATKADPGMMQSVGENQEITKEEAAVMPVGGLRRRRRDRNVSAGRRQKPKRRIQASLISRKRLTIAGRKVSRRARVAWRKRNIARKDCARPNVIQEIQRGRTFGRRRQPKPKCSKSIRRWGVEEPLHLRRVGKPPTVSDNGAEDISHDWKVWETVTRSSGKPSDWSSGSEHSESQAGHEEGGISHCGGVHPLRNRKTNGT